MLGGLFLVCLKRFNDLLKAGATRTGQASPTP